MAINGLDRNPTQIDISLKKLLNLEFTSTNKSVAQELGANTIDINSTEVFTDSVSSTPADAVTAGVAKKLTDFILTPDPNVNSAFYVISGGGDFEPTGDSDEYDPAKKQRNFLSPKYGTDYEVVLKDNTGTQIFASDLDWFFDYKTGIMFLENGDDQSFTPPFKVTAYQYVGKTLNTSLTEAGSVSGIFTQTGSFQNTTNNVGITGSFVVTGASATVDFDGVGGGVTGSFTGSFDGAHTGTGNFSTVSTTGNVTVGGVLTTTSDVTVGGNLQVNGSTTFIETNILQVEDSFILLNASASEAGGRDGGIVVETADTDGQGTALFWDHTNLAWSIKANGVSAGATNVTPDVTVVTVTNTATLPSDASLNSGVPFMGAGDQTGRSGHMHIKSDDGTIWIYAPSSS